MLYDENQFPVRISLREVVAAWACCGLVALGAFLGAAVDRRKEAPLAMFARVHIPASGAMSVRAAHPGDEPDDAADGETKACLNWGKASVCPALDVAAYSNLQTVPSAPTC
jgi:hypothetical protein